MKLIFLDRDGVINRDPGGGDYVKSWREFHFLPGAIEAICKLTKDNYKIIVISNQAGVSKGLFTQESLNRITKNMLKEIEESGGKVKSVYYCPHRDEDNCDCRKPKTGLFRKATAGLNIDLRKTYFIGDGQMDIEAGKRAGCKTILVLSGKSKLEDRDKWQFKPDYVAKNLLEAANWIVNENPYRLRLCRGRA